MAPIPEPLVLWFTVYGIGFVSVYIISMIYLGFKREEGWRTVGEQNNSVTDSFFSAIFWPFVVFITINVLLLYFGAKIRDVFHYLR